MHYVAQTLSVFYFSQSHTKLIMMGTGLTEMATVSAMGKSLCFKAAVMSSGPSNVLAVI